MIIFANYLFTALLIIWIFLEKKPQFSFIPLLVSGLSGIPIYYFGKSSSGGIFPVDVLAVTIILRFAIKYGRTWFKIVTKRGVFLPFISLTIWATFSSVYAITQTNYGEKYFLFLLYGIGRWWTFAFFVFLFFGYQFKEDEYFETLKKLFFAFCIYGIVLLSHQFGFSELSGREGLGPRIVETTQNILDTYEIKSMFWGSNRSCVGAICFTGFWLAILLWSIAKDYKWRRKALILATIMIIGLVGSWSRSDFTALVLSFITFMIITKKKIGTRAKNIGFIVFAIVINIWAIFTILDIKIESPTIERFSVLLSDKWHEEGTGKYRREMHSSIIEYLKNNKEILLLGTGANGFRSLFGEAGIWSNAAHNTFLHNLTELGAIGIFLLILFIYRILRLSCFLDTSDKYIICPILISFILGRFVAGYAADTLFAVDAMISANVMFLSFVGLLVSKSSVFCGQR